MPKIRDLVTIERKGKLESVRGFLLAKSKEWLLVEREKEFLADGYRLVRRKDVINIRRNAADKLHQVICAMRGVVPGPAPKVPFEDPEKLFHALRSKGELVIIGCERIGEWPFTIGKIEGIAGAHVRIAYFDIAGKFDKSPRVVAYRHISQIGFAEHYIQGYLTYFLRKKEKRLREWKAV